MKVLTKLALVTGFTLIDLSANDIAELPLVPEKTVDGVAGLSEQDLAEATPYIVRGIVRDWPVVQAGQESSEALRAYLLSYHNQQPVMVSTGPSENQGRIFYKDDMSLNVAIAKSGLREVFERIAATEQEAQQACIYIAAIAMEGFFPGLSDQNPLQLAGKSAHGRLWMGTRTRIAPHNDSQSNFACVAAGRRRFTLFPPSAFRDLYIGPLDNTPAGRPISMVDVLQPDFEAHPKYRDALNTASVADLNPGDGIYIPPLWWHHVEGLEPFNILVNYWWRQSPNPFGLPEPALDHAILAFRDLPQEERAYWRDVFDHYVFGADAETSAHIPEGKRGALGKMTPQLAGGLRAKLKRYFQR